MGLKSKLEQARRRAEREGRLEDAVYLEGLINDLVKARGDAAYARAQNTRTYDVKPGDTFFSVAEEELGSVDWAPELVAANEGIYQLHPGIVLHLPEVGEESGLEAFETLEEAEAKAAYAGQGRAGELREMEEARRAANAADAEQARDGVDRDAALEQKADILGLTQEQEEALLQTLEQELPKWLEEWGFGGFGAAAAESTAGTKVDERPAQQGETPEPQGKGGDLAYLERWHEYTLEQLQNSEPTSSAEIIEQMNRYYRLRSKIEQGEITQQDLEGWGYTADLESPAATPTTQAISSEDYDTSIDLYILAEEIQRTQPGLSIQDALQQGYEIQNQFDSLIVSQVTDPEGPWANRPDLQDQLVKITKRLIVNESQFIVDALDPSDSATGLGQIIPGFLSDVITHGYLPNREYDLFEPGDNIAAIVASLRFLYDGIQSDNQEQGWVMGDEDVLKLAVGLYNTGWGGDFGLENRILLETGQLNHKDPGCTDPTQWECLEAIFFTQIVDDDGEFAGYNKNPRSLRYVENIFSELNAPAPEGE